MSIDYAIESRADGTELFYGEQRGKVMLFSAAQVAEIVSHATAPVRQPGDAIPLDSDGRDVLRGMRNGKDVLYTASAVRRAIDSPQTPNRRATAGAAIPVTIYGDETIQGVQRGIVMEFGAAQILALITALFWFDPFWNRDTFWTEA